MNNADFLKEMREIQSICDKAANGENVFCPKCGELLQFFGVDSGKHPGVFCPNNDFQVLINLKTKEDR
ncbi:MULTISPECIES: hypothetical protein [Brevibacillus]|uniref:Uncharacterized protein n=1 Tax=Brevibacillus antibioticus TaxID=2570228 RepID=A0A4U2Y3Q4_9BACL|nr:hypothetical protein [Brevibacillus antibioticus]TKI55110.1 hypothetical protein E8L90_06360 [Brevibacillus antibioticus]